MKESNQVLKEKSIQAIREAITILIEQGKKVTQKNVAELTTGKVSLGTIKRYFKEAKSVSGSVSPVSSKTVKSVSPSSTFERFKRRAKQTPKSFTPFSPSML